jgi:hypothetical protein
MRRMSVVLVAVALAACAKAEKPAAEPAAAAPPPAPAAPAPLTMADVAGKWAVNVMPEAKDTVILSYTMSIDSTGMWDTFPGRKPMAMKMSMSGDSMMIMSNGNYESMLRKGKMVSTTSVTHMSGGKMMGRTMAHYAVKTADSVLALRMEATKMP